MTRSRGVDWQGQDSAAPRSKSGMEKSELSPKGRIMILMRGGAIAPMGQESLQGMRAACGVMDL